MKKFLLIQISAILLLLISCACNSRYTKTEVTKAEFVKFNPFGKNYNDVIQYFEINDWVYMRMVSDLNNNFLCSFDHSDTTLKNYYFNDDNVCYRFQLHFFERNKIDSIVNWLNSNFEKIPDESAQWKDLQQNLTFEILDSAGIFSLWCTSDSYLQITEQDDRIRVDFNNVYGFDDEEKEWYEIANGEWSTFDEVAGEMFEYKFSTNRFVIPIDLKGKIEHFRTQGKMLTYEITEPLYVEKDMLHLIVKDENDVEFCFAVHVDLLSVMFIYADGEIILFADE